MPSLALPVTVKINNKDFIHYKTFNIRRTLGDFIDTFSLVCNNPAGLYSREMLVGHPINVYFQGVEIFRGMIEKKNSDWKDVGSTMSIGGREELADIAEDDVDPSLGPWENITDNQIISYLIDGTTWLTDFDAGVTIKKYDIRPGSSRKGEIATEIASQNNFYLWKKGRTLFKRKIPESGQEVRATFVHSVGLNSRSEWTKDIMGFSINEDLQHARSMLKASAYEEGKAKEGTQLSMENPSVRDGTYHKIIRNLLSGTSRPLSRKTYASLPTTDDFNTTEMAKKLLQGMSISASINLTLSGFHDFDLMDTVIFDSEPEGIYNTMYVSSIEYNFGSENQRTTLLTLMPYGIAP